MLDVIVTISESTPHSWVGQCRRSVAAAVAACPYPVNMIEVPGVPGHVGNAMLGGLMRSTADYVAWVDDDDFVLPNAFACLARHFGARPDAVCAREIHLLASGRFVPAHRRHHLTAFRRDIVDSVSLSDYPARPNRAIHEACGEVADELSWVYVYRIRRSPAMVLRANYRSG